MTLALILMTNTDINHIIVYVQITTVEPLIHNYKENLCIKDTVAAPNTAFTQFYCTL